MPRYDKKSYRRYVDDTRTAAQIGDEQIDRGRRLQDRQSEYAKNFQDDYSDERYKRGMRLDDIHAGLGSDKLDQMFKYGTDLYDYSRGAGDDLNAYAKKYWDTASGKVDVGQVQGYRDSTKAALTGSAIDKNNERYAAALKSAKLAMTRRGGGGGMPSGYIPGMAEMLSNRERDRAGALRDITIGDEDQYNKNLENARKFALGERDLQQGGMSSAFNALGRGYDTAIGGMAKGAGAYGSAYDSGYNALRVTGDLYDPYKYGTLLNSANSNVNTAYGNSNDAYRTRAGTIAQPNQEGQSLWKNLLGSAAGIGLNWVTGGLLGGGGGGGGMTSYGYDPYTGSNVKVPTWAYGGRG